MRLVNQYPVVTAWICGCFFNTALDLGATGALAWPWVIGACVVLMWVYMRAARWQRNMETLYYALTYNKPEGYTERAVVNYFKERDKA